MTRVRIVLPVLLVIVAGHVRLVACAVCFQMQPNATTNGVHAAVITLVAITTCVLGGFLRFIVRFARTQDPGTSGTTEPPKPQ